MTTIDETTMSTKRDITFFTIPKPFEGHIGMIQRNAIASWAALGPHVRVVLMGNEPGTREAARTLGVEHEPNIRRSRFGTPLLDSLFEQIEHVSAARLFNYINADIVLLDDFPKALAMATRGRRRLLMVGRRTDLDVQEPIDFRANWQSTLRQRAARAGRLHRATGIDYFVFNRGLWGTLPPFAVGRFTWDNWMIHRARTLGAIVIDASSQVLAIHQNHHYAHAGGLKNAWHGVEAKRNRSLAGDRSCLYTIWDSTHILTNSGVTRRTAEAGDLGGGIWSDRRSGQLDAA